jgi:uncharacterized protein (DUF433 family)
VANSPQLLGSGIYTVSEAAHLTKVSAPRIRRWMKGYDFKTKKERHHSRPVWTGQIEPIDGKIAVGFSDLMEIRFVSAFISAGVSWKTMRSAHHAAKVKLKSDHPFSTHTFATDGRQILLDQAEASADQCLIDITTDQREFKKIVVPFLRELEFDHGYTRWWPMGKNRSVVLDPTRNLGQPIVTAAGIPTRVLAGTVLANGGSMERVARWYEVALDEVRDAVEFEAVLASAA